MTLRDPLTLALPLLMTSFDDIMHCDPKQETLEDIDKNGDGHVDEDEYIGESTGSPSPHVITAHHCFTHPRCSVGVGGKSIHI